MDRPDKDRGINVGHSISRAIVARRFCQRNISDMGIRVREAMKIVCRWSPTGTQVRTERIGTITLRINNGCTNDYGRPRVYGVDKLIIIVSLDSCRLTSRRLNSSRTRLPWLRRSCRDGVLRNARSHGMTVRSRNGIQLLSVHVFFVSSWSAVSSLTRLTMIHKLGRA